MKRFLFSIITLVILLSVCTCASDDLLGSLTDSSEATGGGGVRFGVNNSGTRLTANGLKRSFDDGDLVGCVVCTLATTTTDDGSTTYGYEMLVNSKWAVDGTNGTLRPIEYWAEGSSGGSLERTVIGDASDLLFDYDDDSGNTIINYVDGLYDAGDGALYFFYYTPYVEPDETSTTALDSVPRDTTYTYTYTQSTDTDGNLTISKSTSYTVGNYMMGPATDNSLAYSGASSLTAYDWQAFPLYVHRDQRTDAHSAASAWMAEQYTKGLYPGSEVDVSLVFEPLTADLLVTAGEELAYAALVPLESTTTSEEESDTESSSSTASITLGKQANLQKGTLSQWTWTDVGDSATTDTIYGHADGYNYLFHLAPQENFSARLLFRYKDETLADGYARYMDLNAFTGTDGTTTGMLSAGAQYDVTVPSRYGTATQYLYFTSSSAYEESASSFFTVATRSDPSSTPTFQSYASSDGYSLKKSGIVADCDTFEYVIKFQNTSGKGEFVGFEVPSEYGSMTLAIYARNQSSTPSLCMLTLPSDFDFSNVVATSTDDATLTVGDITYTPTAITATAATDDNSNAIFVFKETLQAGYKYMIYWKSGTSHAYLIVLTNDVTIDL